MLCRRTRCQSRSASRHETPTLSLLRRLVLTTRRSVAPPKKSTSANADVEKGTGKDRKARKRKPQRGGMRPELKVWWHSLAQQPRLNYATPPGSPQPTRANRYWPAATATRIAALPFAKLHFRPPL
jgi:hypothetical protein